MYTEKELNKYEYEVFLNGEPVPYEDIIRMVEFNYSYSEGIYLILKSDCEVLSKDIMTDLTLGKGNNWQGYSLRGVGAGGGEITLEFEIEKEN